MPLFVPQAELDAAETLRDENDRMAQELAEFREMGPLLALANEVRTEIVAFFDGQPELNAREISERAYQNVLARNIDKARDEAAARYEQEHRRALYERLLGQVSLTEGESISAGVRQKVETDPALATDLRDSARKELAARARDVVRDEITAEQQAIIDEEADRLIALDRLDVKVAVERELDLASDEVKDLIKPGDKVELIFKIGESKRGRLTLTWARDANGKEGWVFVDCNQLLMDARGNAESISKDRFVQIAAVNKDLENGDEVPQVDRLIVGLPLMLMQRTPKGGLTKTKLMTREGTHGYSPIVPVILEGTDFQTKDIVFTGTTGVKQR